MYNDAPDAALSQRPGVPMETEPKIVGHAHWSRPEQQPDPGYILKRKGLEHLTPVFGTAVPPRGLSGLMRRAAYEIPDHRTSHWLLLLLSDRVDAYEDRMKRALPWVLPFVAVGTFAMVLKKRTRRSWF